MIVVVVSRIVLRQIRVLFIEAEWKSIAYIAPFNFTSYLTSYTASL